MTDAEPASSPEAQVQVKFRPGIQVTALTPFSFAFYNLRLLPESQRYYIPFNAFNSRLRRRRGQALCVKSKVSSFIGGSVEILAIGGLNQGLVALP